MKTNMKANMKVTINMLVKENTEVEAEVGVKAEVFLIEISIQNQNIIKNIKNTTGAEVVGGAEAEEGNQLKKTDINLIQLVIVLIVKEVNLIRKLKPKI